MTTAFKFSMLSAQRYQFGADKSKQVLGLTEHAKLLEETFSICNTLHSTTKVSALSHTLNPGTKRHLDSVLKDLEREYVQANLEEQGSSGGADYDAIYLKERYKLDSSAGELTLEWNSVIKALNAKILGPNALTKCKDEIMALRVVDDPTLEFFTARFTDLLKLYKQLGGPSTNPDYLQWYLKALPRDIHENMISLPTSLEEAANMAHKLGTNRELRRSLYGDESSNQPRRLQPRVPSLAVNSITKQGPHIHPSRLASFAEDDKRGEFLEDPNKDAQYNAIVASLRQRDQDGSLLKGVAALKGTPDERVCDAVPFAEHESVRAGVTSAITYARNGAGLIAAITHLIPDHYVKKTTHNTEVTSKYDLGDCDKNSILKRHKLFKRAQAMKGRSGLDSSDEESDTEVDPEPRSVRRSSRGQGSKKRKEPSSNEDKSVSAMSEFREELEKERETSRMERGEMQQQIAALSATPYSRNSGSTSYAAPNSRDSSNSPYAGRAARKPFVFGACFGCGETTHQIGNCPKTWNQNGSKVPFCWTCKSLGHRIENCPNKQPDNTRPTRWSNSKWGAPGGCCPLCSGRGHQSTECPDTFCSLCLTRGHSKTSKKCPKNGNC